MADELPEPKSRKESYLAKAAGMDVTIPEKPESRLEQYLDAIAEGGGGGGGGTSDFNELENRPKYNGTAMTGETDIPIAPTVVQTTGTSTTDVMSQNATTSMVFGDPGTNTRIRIGANAVVDNLRGVSIGEYSNGYGGSVSIGTSAGWGGSGVNRHRTCIGHYAGQRPSSGEQGSISLGAYSKASVTGEMNIGSTDTSYGYNNTNYRLLTGVHDPVDAHDAATKGYVDANAGGPTVVQATGTSTTDVMSQNAITGMVFIDPSTCNTIRMGNGANVGNYDESVVIGRNSNGSGVERVSIGKAAGFQSTVCPYCVCIGSSAGLQMSSVSGSVSLGAYSKATRTGEVHIGTTNTSYGYNSTNYRVLGGVHDGQDAHDAVTVNQVNATIDAINTALSTSIPHIGATS